MITIRKASERGGANHGWLDAKHTFSFADYYEPKHMGFRSLRVINEDRIEPGRGFGSHGHRDMEIVTYVINGQLAHKDSMGNGSVLSAGEFQRMTAGRGVMHSEHNPSHDDELHLYQIWVKPETKGLEPGYEELKPRADEVEGRWRVVASRDARDGSMTIHQDASIHLARVRAGESLEYAIGPDRHAWIQVVHGAVDVNGQSLETSDGAAVETETTLTFAAREDAEVLLFDLA